MESTPTMEAVCREDELFNDDRNYAGRSGEERVRRRRRRRQRRMKGERRGRKEEEKQNEGDREDNILKNTKGGGLRLMGMKIKRKEVGVGGWGRLG